MLPIVLLIAFVAAGVGLVMVWAPLQESMQRSSAKAREDMSRSLEEMFIFIPLEHLPTVRVGALVLLGLAGFLLAYNTAAPGPYIAAGIFGLLGYFLPQILVAWLRRRRRRMFSEQIMDGLILLSNSLRASLTLQQSIEMLVEESRPPLSQEFELTLREHRLGVDLDLALENCAKRTRDEDLELATTAVAVTRQLGGNIAEIFDRIVNMIKARKLLKGKADALTAQGRAQALVVGLMPYLFGFFVMKINPDLMRIMWTTLPGFGCLLLVVVLDLVGYFWVLKITNVKY